MVTVLSYNVITEAQEAALASLDSQSHLTPMVNMSRILFPCSQPTSMMTPETQRQSERADATETPRRRHGDGLMISTCSG